ncbi:MAG: 23S rRNA (guanosine(2251)-2'-O)-methyltransferase RlmB [Cyanobacteria bacterium NC_groundwater_1444_Ag_S-0.65um_54_12]|nr:23S rRNA (guanosine(2251)-2'-O)-methyltransferase RlmB [Cyanobacteria bacterium NC_groundwater_1444_Ag_S-0.65um_54_12]
MQAANAEVIWGRHAVVEALKGDRTVNKIWLLRSLADKQLATLIYRLAREKRAPVQEVDRGKLDQLAHGPHQGIVAALSPMNYTSFEELIEQACRAAQPLLLVLAGIADPHNLGALIRSADAAGAQGVVLPMRRAAALTGTVAKAAAGALEYVPVARVTNISQALKALKKAGFWIVAADEAAAQVAYEVDLTVPIALVIGAEGSGLPRLVSETCDFAVRIPLYGHVSSLNASVAGALLLFEAVRQRHQSTISERRSRF